LRTRLRDERRVVAWIPPGGSDATGTLGWVRGGAELAGRLGDVGIDRATIVVAVSTGGTVAGLSLGLARSGRRDRVLGVCVYRSRERTAEVVDQLMRDTAERLAPGRHRGDAPAAVAPPPDLTDEFLGAGYGLPTPEMRAAVELLARTEGIAADPVYSGKALAAVVERCRLGRLGHRDGRDEPVVVVLTGGGPGLFAYPDVFGAEPSGD
jgi:1-aminocyclopropane-1-carboxylate deaminase/D-cysteine desulfhydrase-like pyridoxal-dependent ACC family enzyme